MKYRAAFASSDGLVVNRHFGQADRFLIADIDEEGDCVDIIEHRIVGQSVCEGYRHSEEKMAALADRLADCRVVFAARVGPGAQEFLKNRGIQGISMPYPIRDLTDALLHAKVRIVQELPPLDG